MPLIRKFVYFLPVFVVFAMIFSFSNKMSDAKESSRLLLFACNGEQHLMTIGNDPSKVAEKLWVGDVPRGFLFANHFWYIDNHNLMSRDLSSKETVTLVDIQDFVESGYMPWQIGYVDDKHIFFSALKYDSKTPIAKQEKLSRIYRFDKSRKEIQQVGLGECGSPYFSVFRGKIYFSSLDGGIYEFDGFTNRYLGVKGDFPSVSPDGNKLAFSSFGIIYDTIQIYEITTGKKSSLIKFTGPKGVKPILRWSSDSNLLAVKKKSDLKLGSLYIIDTISKQTIQKIDGSNACNWFFVTR